MGAYCWNASRCSVSQTAVEWDAAAFNWKPVDGTVTYMQFAPDDYAWQFCRRRTYNPRYASMNVAEYKDPKGFRITLAQGDIFEVQADVMIFGRTAEIRKRLDENGAKFRPVSEDLGCKPYSFCGREVTKAKSEFMPWHTCYSIPYRERSTGVNSIHVQRLAQAVHTTIRFCTFPSLAKHIAIVPMGWRTPKQLAYALLSAVIPTHHPLIRFPDRITICALHDLSALQSVLDDDKEFRRIVSTWPFRSSLLPSRKRLFTEVRANCG